MVAEEEEEREEVFEYGEDLEDEGGCGGAFRDGSEILSDGRAVLDGPEEPEYLSGPPHLLIDVACWSFVLEILGVEGSVLNDSQ